MFSEGEYVIYGNKGICRIAGIRRGVFGDSDTREYFILKHGTSNIDTIYVPTDNETLTGTIRRLLTKEEIYALFDMLPDGEVSWVENNRQREEEFAEIINKGDRAGMFRLIKTLCLHRQKQTEIGKKLHMADDRILERAREQLFGEFALVLGIEPGEVPSFIREHAPAGFCFPED